MRKVVVTLLIMIMSFSCFGYANSASPYNLYLEIRGYDKEMGVVDFIDCSEKFFALKRNTLEEVVYIEDLVVRDHRASSFNYDGPMKEEIELVASYGKTYYLGDERSSIDRVANRVVYTINSKMEVDINLWFLDKFRVVVVDEDHRVYVSDEIELSTVTSHVIWNMTTGEIYTMRNMATANLTTFLKMFSVTIVIEGAILWMLKMASKRNFIIFLFTNIMTQLSLMALILLLGQWEFTISGMLLFGSLEFIVFFVEAFFYRRLMKGFSGKLYNRYALVANATSAILGTYLLSMIL